MNMKKVCCELCGQVIPPERLEILPDTTTCVKCSQTKPYSGDEVLGLKVTDDHEHNHFDIENFEENDDENSLSIRDIW